MFTCIHESGSDHIHHSLTPIPCFIIMYKTIYCNVCALFHCGGSVL